MQTHASVEFIEIVLFFVYRRRSPCFRLISCPRRGAQASSVEQDVIIEMVLAGAHLGTRKQSVLNDPLVQGDFTDLSLKFDQRGFYPLKLFIPV